MKKFYLTFTIAISALFVFGIVAFQSKTSAASNYALPSATPRKRTVNSNINANVKAKIKSNKPNGFTEVSGLTQETQQRKHPRRKSTNKIWDDATGHFDLVKSKTKRKNANILRKRKN